LVAIRLPADVISAVDQWAKDNAVSRSAAIRQWVEQALAQALAAQSQRKPAKEPIAPAVERDSELERLKAKNRDLKAKLREMGA